MCITPPLSSHSLKAKGLKAKANVYYASDQLPLPPGEGWGEGSGSTIT